MRHLKCLCKDCISAYTQLRLRKHLSFLLLSCIQEVKSSKRLDECLLMSTAGDVDFSGIGKKTALTPLGAEISPGKG